MDRPRGRRRRWAGSFEVNQVGHWAYEVGAWTDNFATWHDEVARKRAADDGEDLSSEVAEGALLLREAAGRAAADKTAPRLRCVHRWRRRCERPPPTLR